MSRKERHDGPIPPHARRRGRLRVSLAGLHVALPLCADPISLHPSTAAFEVLTDLIDDFDRALQ